MGIIGTGLLAAAGHFSLEFGLLAVCLGIFIGDTGLYAFGRSALIWPALRRRLKHPMIDYQLRPLRKAPWHQLALIRCMPGVRTFGYIACGLARVPLAVFCVANAISVVIWATMLYGIAYALGKQFAETINDWLILLLPISLILFFWCQRRMRRHIEASG